MESCVRVVPFETVTVELDTGATGVVVTTITVEETGTVLLMTVVELAGQFVTDDAHAVTVMSVVL